jgi:hypothetical protein
MDATVTCPDCGADHPAGTPACGCGHAFPTSISTDPDRPPGGPKGGAPPPESGRPITIDRPFDLGKPLGTPHPVSQVCPQCGSTDYQAVKPAAMVAFTSDRVCRACSTRYTPPTPAWARVVFGLFGLLAIAAGCLVLHGILYRDRQPALGYLTAVVPIIVGVGCLYKAATK